MISVFARHHFGDGIHSERVFTHWAEHRGVAVGGDGEFFQGLYGGPRGGLRSAGGGGGGGEVIDKAVEVRAAQEEIVAGGGKRGGVGVVQEGGGVHIHLLEEVEVTLEAENRRNDCIFSYKKLFNFNKRL